MGPRNSSQKEHLYMMTAIFKRNALRLSCQSSDGEEISFAFTKLACRKLAALKPAYPASTRSSQTIGLPITR